MSDLKKREGENKFKQVKTSTSAGTDNTTQESTETRDTEGTSRRVAETVRALSGKTTQTQSNREKVNIGFEITFTVPILQNTPIDPSAGSC